MKKTIFISLLFCSVLLAHTVRAQEVLRTETITVHGNKINLPVTKEANGTVCQTYLKEVFRHEGFTETKVGRICGAPVIVFNDISGPEIHPAGLVSMKTIIVDGEVKAQVPELD